MQSLDRPKPAIFSQLLLEDICNHYLFILIIKNIKVSFTVSEFSMALKFWFPASCNCK